MTELSCFKAYAIRNEISATMSEGIAYRIERTVAQHASTKSVVFRFAPREAGRMCARMLRPVV